MAFVFKKISPVRRKVRIAKSERSKKVLADLTAYIESGYEEPMKWLLRTWKKQAGSFKYSDLYSIATDEPLPGSVFDGWFKSYSEWLTGKMTDSWKEAMLAGWKNNPALEGVKEFTFNSSETRVRSWIQNHGAELVTNCIQEQKSALQYLVAEGQSKGISSAELGRYIRPTIGLTRPQAAANLRHYEALKEQLRKDHPRMTQESIEQKARASAARYAAKQQRYRAETIARTEIAYAYNKGYDESVRQAMSQRLLPIMKKVWVAANADHVCPICEDLDGTTLDMDQEFQTTRGVRVIRNVSCSEPPIHPRCRCALIYEETGEYVQSTDTLETDAGEGEQNYYDITEEWSHEKSVVANVEDATEFISQGITYKVDGKDVKVEYTMREKEVGELLAKHSGERVIMAPKVTGAYHNVHTPDYLVGTKLDKWDLKEIHGSSKDIIRNVIHKKYKQADHFVIDITHCPLDLDEIYRQSENIFKAGNTKFVNELMIIRENSILRVLRKK